MEKRNLNTCFGSYIILVLIKQPSARPTRWFQQEPIETPFQTKLLNWLDDSEDPLKTKLLNVAHFKMGGFKHRFD